MKSVCTQETPLGPITLRADEGALTALNREVYEETGWSISGHRRLGAYRRFTYMPEYDRWAEKVCHIYLARPALRRGPPSEPGHTAFWMSGAEALAALSNSGDRHFMAKVLQNLG